MDDCDICGGHPMQVCPDWCDEIYFNRKDWYRSDTGWIRRVKSDDKKFKRREKPTLNPKLCPKKYSAKEISESWKRFKGKLPFSVHLAANKAVREKWENGG